MFVRCSAWPAQSTACHSAAGSQQEQPAGEGVVRARDVVLWGAGAAEGVAVYGCRDATRAMRAACGALSSRVNGGHRPHRRRCGQGGRHKHEARAAHVWVARPTPFRTALPHPLLHSRLFLLLQAEASPLLSPSGARTPQRRTLLALAALAAAGTAPEKCSSSGFAFTV
jgi:hypothetical protein